MVRSSVIALAIVAASAPVALYAASSAIPAYVTAAVADTTRPAADRATDANRKPAETIAFAGVKPGMIVGEFYPGGGYFTRMLSDVVGPKGHVYGIENLRWDDPKADKALLDATKGNVSLDVRAFGTVDFPKPLDVAWVTQNYHDMKIAKYGVVDTVAFDRGVFNALKPGGTFFIHDNEAPPGTDVAGITKLHRIERSQVIAEVTSVGFKLAAEGNFLRRPSDDHSLSIFDPKVRGKTDQYARKFVKPARATKR